jgi:hypothetical protein
MFVLCVYPSASSGTRLANAIGGGSTGLGFHVNGQLVNIGAASSFRIVFTPVCLSGEGSGQRDRRGHPECLVGEVEADRATPRD